MSKETAAIRDQLGTDPKVFQVLITGINETFGIEGNPLVLESNTLGNAWIVGSSTNGIVGANTGTVGGGQQVVGGDGRIRTFERVVNPKREYHNHFRWDDFKDDNQPNTADWDTTNYRLAMSDGVNHNRIYNGVATFKSIALLDGQITRAVITATENRWNLTDKILYFLSSDGGNSWEQFTLGQLRNFDVVGFDLRLRITMIGNGGKDTYIEDLAVNYS